MSNEVTAFAQTNFRNEKRRFGIKTDDRRRHMYLIGKTGMGKSVLIENLVYSDIINGHGVCHIDPHGDSAELLVNCIPSHRINDVIYMNPADSENPIAFNVLEKVDHKYRHLVASGLIGVFKKIWADSWGPRLEYLLRNTILALLDYPDSTLLGVNRMLIDKDYRKKVVDKVEDPVVKMFWTDEFTKYNQSFLTEAIAPIQNKVGQFLSTSLIRNIVGQVKSTLDIRKIMDEGKILILNFSKGRIGEDASALLGAMMITKIQLAAMSRVDIPETERKDFYLYVDEFQNFATEAFANILSEARKYHLNLTLAHQYIGQLEIGGNTVVRDAVFGNVGTIVTFRVGAADAEFLVREFTPRFEEEDLVNIPKWNIYLKLMIDGVASEPFSAGTLPPLSQITNSLERIEKVTRERYSRPREVVEDKIARWSGVETPEMLAKLEREIAEKKAKELTDRKPDFLASMNGEKEEEDPKANSEEIKEDDEARTESKSSYSPSSSSRDKDSNKDKEEYLEVVNCDGCGTKTKVNFKPDPNRPLYCKECLKDHRRVQALQENMQKKRADAGISSAKPTIARDHSAKSTPVVARDHSAKSTSVVARDHSASSARSQSSQANRDETERKDTPEVSLTELDKKKPVSFKR